MTTRSLSLQSCAKINLGLRVLGKRSDGYHEIRTILQTISLHDDLHFQATNGSDISFACNDTNLPSDASNLAVKAAEALRQKFRVHSGVGIRLEKRIPVQGGLGGGSSNAAITLIGLSRFWGLNPTKAELLEMASSLGADVPFFLEGGRALASGIGTEITSLSDIPKQHLIVVAPNARIATADAYKALNARALTTPDTVSILAISRTAAISSDWEQWPLSDHLENDFERVIFDIQPEIRRAKETLERVGASSALLAGSGSSVFGVFANEEEQSRAAEVLRAESDWRIFSCVTLSRDEYLYPLCSASLGVET